jgi:hypothetical protein
MGNATVEIEQPGKKLATHGHAVGEDTVGGKTSASPIRTWIARALGKTLALYASG